MVLPLPYRLASLGVSGFSRPRSRRSRITVIISAPVASLLFLPRMFQIYHTRTILPVSTLIYTWMDGLTDPSLKPLGLIYVLAIMNLPMGLIEVYDVGDDGPQCNSEW